jgi:beta-lactamase regulating signal transducer with metallopeptidase domain
MSDSRAGLRERVWKFALVAAFVTASVQVGLGFEPLGGRLALIRGAAQAAGDAPQMREPPAMASLQPRSEPFALTATDPLMWPVWLAREVLVEDSANADLGEAQSHTGEELLLAQSQAQGLQESGSDASTIFGWGAWTSWAFASCALGTLGGLVLFALLWVRLNGCLRDRIALEHGALFDSLRDLRARSGVRRKVRLSVAPSLGAPISMGFFRAEICVPPRVLLELSVEEQEALLAHELAHIVRRDPLWLASCRLFEGVFFFQPLNRVARREIEDCAEFLSDAWAVRHTGLRFSLASCLTRIAEWIVGDRRMLPAPAMAHGRSRLRHRVELLLDEQSADSVDRRPRWLLPACLSFGSALILCVPCVSATEGALRSGDSAGLTMLPESSRDSGAAALADHFEIASEPRASLESFETLAEELDASEVELAELRKAAQALGLHSNLAHEIEAEIQQIEMKLAHLRELTSRLDSIRSSARSSAQDLSAARGARSDQPNMDPTHMTTRFEESSR